MEKIRAIIRIRPQWAKPTDVPAGPGQKTLPSHKGSKDDAQIEKAKNLPCMIKSSKNSVFCELKTKKFEFEHVFDYSDTSSSLFDASIKDTILQSIEGYNVCIFAYGQTSSGKTYTMKGNQQDPGIIPRSLAELYNAIERQHKVAGATDPEKGKFQTNVKISFIEIYNEMIRDLLNPERENLKLQTDKNKNLLIED